MKHRPRSLASFLLHLLLLAVVPASAHGLVYSRVDDGDLADRAAAVAEVRVVSVDPTASPAITDTRAFDDCF